MTKCVKEVAIVRIGLCVDYRHGYLKFVSMQTGGAAMKRSIIVLLLLGMVFWMETDTSAQVSATAIVTSSAANIRGGPGLNYDIIAGAYHGDQFPVTGRARGTNRIWYRITLSGGGSGWLSERIVEIVPSTDGIPWLDDNPFATTFVMDCGYIQPLLYTGVTGSITRSSGVTVYERAGYGHDSLGTASLGEFFLVLDGPFCTRLEDNWYQIQWLVETGSGLRGYLSEALQDGEGGNTPFVRVEVTSYLPDETIRPTVVTNDHIEEAREISRQFADGVISEREVERSFDKLVGEVGADGLAWIVRRVPFYDGKEERWTAFGRYSEEFVEDFDQDARIARDPIGTASDMLFGNYDSPNDMLDWMGFNG